ncbi:MAG: anthranilate phosphoribosyltransferase [Bacteroidales bacterium]|jgi:anthranilate phosphoribosyltransferase
MKDILRQLFEYKTLTRRQAEEVLKQIASGQVNETQMAVFMAVFLMRSITIEELIGFREALKSLAIPVDLSEYQTIDLCGTGGDGKNTFNISTLASFIVAGTGAKVAKHGNYGVSSACGSSNVLEHFGYRFSNSPDKLRNEIEEAGICFLHAPLFNPAMKNVAPVRRQLGIKTFFNILGPMINPSSPKNQLVGVFSLELARMYNYLYQELDVNYAIIHSLDGYDEISLTAPFKLITRKGERIIEPSELGFERIEAFQISGGTSVEESAGIFQRVLNGEGTRAENQVVLANSTIALTLLHPDVSTDGCLESARYSLESGNALKSFHKLIAMNREA